MIQLSKRRRAEGIETDLITEKCLNPLLSHSLLIKLRFSKMMSNEETKLGREENEVYKAILNIGLVAYTLLEGRDSGKFRWLHHVNYENKKYR